MKVKEFAVLVLTLLYVVTVTQATDVTDCTDLQLMKNNLAGDYYLTKGFGAGVGSGSEISNIYTEPTDVCPGDKMLVSADVKDENKLVSEAGINQIDDKTFDIWNKYKHYYIDKGGLQITNYYGDYWVHHTLCIVLDGFEDCSDGLVFDWNIERGGNYNILEGVIIRKDREIRLRYYLGRDDRLISITPIIKNIGNKNYEDLSLVLKVSDIQVRMNSSDDWLRIDDRDYGLGEERVFDNLENRKIILSDEKEFIDLRWDDKYYRNNIENNLEYEVELEDRELSLRLGLGEFNAEDEIKTKLEWVDDGWFCMIYSIQNDCLADGECEWCPADGSCWGIDGSDAPCSFYCSIPETCIGESEEGNCSITLNTANNSVFTDSSPPELNFTAVITEGSGDISCDLIINGLVYWTNSSVLNNTLTTAYYNDLAEYLHSGDYNWNVNCSVGVGDVNSSVTNSFSFTTTDSKVIIRTDDSEQNLTIYGDDASDYSGWSVATGDVNNDGISDVVIGAHYADPAGGDSAGETYVIFGASYASGTTIDLNSVSANITIYGDDAGDYSGMSVATGDVNNDGYDDVIIGAYRADPVGGGDAGETYVIFGASYASGTTIDLNSVSANITIYGDDAGDYSGVSVATGDVNNDGISDVVIGAHYADPAGGDSAGETYVVYGVNLSGEADTCSGSYCDSFPAMFCNRDETVESSCDDGVDNDCDFLIDCNDVDCCDSANASGCVGESRVCKVPETWADSSSWLSGYGFRKQITIDNTNVDDDLTNFPLYVKIDADGNIGGNITDTTDGHDIRFTGSDGTTALKYERESFSVTSGDATGHFWVKVPAIPSEYASAIFLYYGNTTEAAGADGQDAVNVWDANYKGVWHLNDTTDSSGNSHTFTTVVGASSGATGKIGSAYDFESTRLLKRRQTTVLRGFESTPTADYMRFADHSDFDFAAEFSVELILDFETRASNWIFNHYDSSTTDGWALYTAADGKVGFWVSVGGSTGSVLTTAAVSTTGFHQIVGTRDSSGNLKIYLDGVAQAASDTQAGAIDSSGYIALGRRDWNSDTYFDGILDELRASSTSRSVEWIKFEYNNINNAGNELSWGVEATSGSLCNDGLDNDGDNLIDCADAEDCCSSAVCGNDIHCQAGWILSGYPLSNSILKNQSNVVVGVDLLPNKFAGMPVSAQSNQRRNIRDSIRRKNLQGKYRIALLKGATADDVLVYWWHDFNTSGSLNLSSQIAVERGVSFVAASGFQSASASNATFYVPNWDDDCRNLSECTGSMFGCLTGGTEVPAARIDNTTTSDFCIVFNVTGTAIENLALEGTTWGGDVPPTLTDQGVSPTQGTSSTLFNFTVNYTDADNNPPFEISICIGTMCFEMEEADSADTTYTDGKVYYWNGTLKSRSYNITFFAVDSSSSYDAGGAAAATLGYDPEGDSIDAFTITVFPIAQFVAGWNFFSSPVTLDTPTIAGLGVDDNCSILVEWKPAANEFQDQTTIGGASYWLHCTYDAIALFSGTEVASAQTTFTAPELCSGDQCWDAAAGYHSLNAGPIEDIFRSDCKETDTALAVWNPNTQSFDYVTGNTASFDYLMPCMGYYIKKPNGELPEDMCDGGDGDYSEDDGWDYDTWEPFDGDDDYCWNSISNEWEDCWFYDTGV